MMQNARYRKIMTMMKESGASDLYLCPNEFPVFRVKNKLKKVGLEEKLSPDEVRDFIFDTMTDLEQKTFIEEREIDYSLDLDGKYFFRINAYHSSGFPEMVVRALDATPPSFDTLGLPGNVKWVAEEYRSGIIIVSGATGSGKSSTLAAVIDHINRTQQKKIITIEDPIEIRHRSISSSVSQREVGKDTKSFGNALKSVLRQRPDVILVGEIRDAETMKIAINASESGHLVLATLHAGSAEEVINRILGFYPINEHQQMRGLIASTLKSVIAQRLATNIHGKTMPLCEVMTSTLRIREAITEGKSNDDLKEIIRASDQDHMQEFDDYIFTLADVGIITDEEALSKCSNPDELLQRLRQLRFRAS